jgi:predicted Zn-dependent protease
VLARLELSIGDTDSALKLLGAAVDERALDPAAEEALALLAGLKLQAGDLAAAERLHLLGDKQFPRSERWPKGLARIYLQTSQAEKLRPVLERLAALDADSVAIRQKLAQLALAAGEFPAATRWATAALRLDVQDAATHALLAAAAAGAQSHATAAEEYATAIRLDGTNAAWRFAQVQTLVKLGRRDAASAALAELRELDADYPGLDALEKTIAP